MSACITKADEPVITDNQFVMLYVDLSIAAEQYLADSLALVEVQDSIFEAHSVTRDDFDNYKANLDDSPERWSKLWEMVIEELNKREEAIDRDSSKSDS